jgi:multiple sugar transport system permease protein
MSTIAAPRQQALLRRLRWEGLPYWLTLPAIGYLLIFFAWPMVQSFGLAFRAHGTWTLANVRGMLNDPQFGQSLKFTLLLIVVIVPLQFILAFAMALLVNAGLRGRGILLYIFLLPLAISDLAAGIVWSSIFTENGYLNTALHGLGVIGTPIIWINPEHQTYLFVAVVVAEIWRSTAIVMIVLVAGLQGISRDYTEAAEVFGATLLQRIRHVTLPMLKPSIQVALVLRVILAFEMFSTVIAITGTGSTVLAEQAWRWQTDYRQQGIAAAYAALILALSLVSAAVIFGTLRTPKERLAQ